MSEIKIHSVLTLEDGLKYVVVAKIEYEKVSYDYLLQISPDEENVTNHVALVKEIIENQELYIEKITDKKEIDSLIPLFQKVLKEG